MSLLALKPGARFGPYVVERPIGRGGMGAVALVRHEETAAPYALKVIYASRLGSDRERSFARFRREAHVLAQMAPHPGIARVHTTGVDGGVPWCVMDYVDGRPLSEELRMGPLPPERAVRLVAEVARAVEHVHRHGVLHRDLKPDNILLEAATGRARLVDFGLAYDLFADRLTRTGEILGTPAFMAPEQVVGKSSDAADAGADGDARGPDDDPRQLSVATDVYGLGAVLHFALTGEAPFRAPSLVAVLAAVMRERVASLRSLVPDVPADLDAICLRALEKSAADRYGSAAAFADDLERWQRGELVHASSASRAERTLSWLRGRGRLPTAIGAALLAVVAAGVVVFGFGRRERARPPAARIARLEEALDRRGRLEPDERAELLALEEAAATLPPDLVARRALVDALDAVLRAGSGSGAEEIDSVARLVRPGGRLDRTLLRRAERTLHRARRLDAVDGLLHGAEPVASAQTLVAVDLARAMAQPEPDAIAPPLDEAAFRAILGAAAMLSSEARARLHLRRGEAALAADEARFDLALAAIERSVAEHGLAPDASAWPGPFRRHALGAFLRLHRDRDARSDALARLLARVDGFVPDPGVVAAFQTLVLFGARDRSARDAEHEIVAHAVLDRFGRGVRNPQDMEELRRQVGVARLVELGREEAGRPPRLRDPARLLFLATLLVDARPEEADRLVDALDRIELDAPWLDASVAWYLERRKEPEPALERWERALAADRRRPDSVRWPMIPERVAMLVRQGAGPTAPDARAGRIVGLAMEASRVQLAAEADLAAINEAGGVAGWRQNRSNHVARALQFAARLLVEAGPPRCCDASSGVPAADEVIEEALALIAHPRLAAANAMSAWTVTPGLVLGYRGRHHAAHGRTDEAVADLDRAVSLERSRATVDRDEDARRREDLATILRARADVLRALGREADADADLAEAEAALRDEGGR